MSEPTHRIAAATIEQSLSMLERYVADDALAPLTAVLRDLVERPNDATLLARLAAVFENLGVLQGAVLTYAPAIAGLLPDLRLGDGD